MFLGYNTGEGDIVEYEITKHASDGSSTKVQGVVKDGGYVEEKMDGATSADVLFDVNALGGLGQKNLAPDDLLLCVREESSRQYHLFVQKYGSLA